MKLFNLFAIIATTANALECEVCNTFLGKVEKAIADENITGNDEIEKKVRAMCKEAKEQDNRFCYYTGLTADAATTMHKVHKIKLIFKLLLFINFLSFISVAIYNLNFTSIDTFELTHQ